MPKSGAAAKKDAQAAMARRHPLIEQARSLAYDMELIDDLGDVFQQAQHTERAEGFTSNESAKRRLRFNPKSRHTTKQQKKELYRRDAYCCQTPGCPNHVWLHVHHLTAYSQGGETVPENLVCLCSSCHKNLHDGHMAIEQNGDGRFIFKDAKGDRLDRFHDLELASWLDHWFGWCGLETNSYSMRVGLGKLKISGACSFCSYSVEAA